LWKPGVDKGAKEAMPGIQPQHNYTLPLSQREFLGEKKSEINMQLLVEFHNTL